MNKDRITLALVVLASMIVGALFAVMLTMSAQQRADVRDHRIRNESVHAELLEFMKCALALPPAPVRTPKMLEDCATEAERLERGKLPKEFR